MTVAIFNTYLQESDQSRFCPLLLAECQILLELKFLRMWASQRRPAQLGYTSQGRGVSP